MDRLQRDYLGACRHQHATTTEIMRLVSETRDRFISPEGPTLPESPLMYDILVVFINYYFRSSYLSVHYMLT